MGLTRYILTRQGSPPHFSLLAICSRCLRQCRTGALAECELCDHILLSSDSSLFSTGQTIVKLSGAEAADRAQCAAADEPIDYWNLLVVFANLKRVIQCACFKSLSSRKGTPYISCGAAFTLVSSSSLQRGHNGLLTLRIIVRCRLRVLCPARRYTSVLRSRRHCRKANCVSPGVTWELPVL